MLPLSHGSNLLFLLLILLGRFLKSISSLNLNLAQNIAVDVTTELKGIFGTKSV